MRTKHTTITATALLALATLTACTPTNNENPNPTQTQQTQTTNPTPTNTTDNAEPIKSDPPTSEEEAITNAKEAFDQAIKVETEIIIEQPSDITYASEYLSPNAMKTLEETLKKINEKGFTLEGAPTFEIDDSQSTTTPRNNGNQQMDYASVHLYGCRDITTQGGTTKDGQPIKYEGDAASHPVHINVIYDPPTGNWLLESTDVDWENKETRC